MTKRKIGVLGAGTWGMALARMLTVSGNEVQVWSAIEAEVDNLSTTRVHPNLPGMKIPAELQFTKSIEEVCTGKDVLLFAVPSVFVRGTTAKARPYIPDGQILVDVAKGMEPDTLYTMTEVIADELNRDGGPKNCRLVALSGPTHAEEVALDLPTTIVSACPDDEAARFVQDVFSNTCMRVYTNPDIKGVELSGALKNVIALGVGISTGLGYGDNARAALITRGIAEIARLGVAMGCNIHTFAGLAGIGDLIVTATSMHSRNNRAGILIGKGESPEQAVKEVGMVVEGINALPAAMELAAKYNVEMPIVQTVNAIVKEGMSASDALRTLMDRNRKNEMPQGQLEAGYCVGMSWVQIMRRIVLPQALRTAVPALSNSLIGMIKDTSLASNITVAELFMAGQRVAARTYIFLPIYCEVAVVYLLFCTVITKLQAVLEHRLNARGFQ